MFVSPKDVKQCCDVTNWIVIIVLVVVNEAFWYHKICLHLYGDKHISKSHSTDLGSITWPKQCSLQDQSHCPISFSKEPISQAVGKHVPWQFVHPFERDAPPLGMLLRQEEWWCWADADAPRFTTTISISVTSEEAAGNLDGVKIESVRNKEWETEMSEKLKQSGAICDAAVGSSLLFSLQLYIGLAQWTWEIYQHKAHFLGRK